MSEPTADDASQREDAEADVRLPPGPDNPSMSIDMLALSESGSAPHLAILPEAHSDDSDPAGRDTDTGSPKSLPEVIDSTLIEGAVADPVYPGAPPENLESNLNSEAEPSHGSEMIESQQTVDGHGTESAEINVADLEPTEIEPAGIEISDLELPVRRDNYAVDDSDGGSVPERAESSSRGHACAWDERDDEVPVPRVVIPQVKVVWSEPLAFSLVDVIDGTDGFDSDLLVQQLPDLWSTLIDAVGQVGFGCLSRESLRWGLGGWQLAPVPHYSPSGKPRGIGADGADPRVQAAGWLQDRYALVSALVRAAVGRWPTKPADALALVEHAAGQIATGLDAVVHLLLHGPLEPGDVGPLYELNRLLDRQAQDHVEFRCFRETLVGSAKAAGRMEDNEDVAGWSVTEDGSMHLAVLDGITGPGDGSGRDAAWVAMRAARTCWQQGRSEPRLVLAVADTEVREQVEHGGATAVFARLQPDGRGELASVGDAATWLLRPDIPERPTQYRAWRLTPVHTEYAEQHRHDPDAQGGQSALTQHLGTARRPFIHRFRLVPHDLLVLVSDGAAAAGTDGEWFGMTLAQLATARVTNGRPTGPGLAADLVIRAERLGGQDNATALVIEANRRAPRDRPRESVRTEGK